MLDERRVARQMEATGISRLQAVRNVQNIERFEAQKSERKRADLVRRFQAPPMVGRVTFTKEV